MQVDGPLGPFAAGIEEVLAAAGYTGQWLSQLMGLVADLSCWLGERGLVAAELRGPVIEEFFVLGGASRSRCRSPRSLKPIVAYLRSVGGAGRGERRQVGAQRG